MARGGAAQAAAVASNRAPRSRADDSIEDLEYIPNNMIPPIHPTAAANPPIPQTIARIKNRTESEGVPLYSVIIKPLRVKATGGDLDDASGQQRSHSNSPIQHSRLISKITLEEILDYVPYSELERFEHLEFREAKAAEEVARAMQEEEERTIILANLAKQTAPKQVGRPSRGRGRGRGRSKGSGRGQVLNARLSASASAEQSREPSGDEGSLDNAGVDFGSSRTSTRQSPDLSTGEQRTTSHSIADIFANPHLVVTSMLGVKRKAGTANVDRRASPDTSASAQLLREESARAEIQLTPRRKRPSPEVIIAPSPHSKKRATETTVKAKTQQDADIIDLDADDDDANGDNIVDLGSSSGSSQPELFVNSPSPNSLPQNGTQEHPASHSHHHSHTASQIHTQNHAQPASSGLSKAQMISKWKRSSSEKAAKAPQHIILEDDDEDDKDSDIQVLSEVKLVDESRSQSSSDETEDTAEQVIESIVDYMNHDGKPFYQVKYVGVEAHESSQYIEERHLRKDARVRAMLKEYRRQNDISDNESSDDGDVDNDEEMNDDEEEESDED